MRKHVQFCMHDVWGGGRRGRLRLARVDAGVCTGAHQYRSRTCARDRPPLPSLAHLLSRVRSHTACLTRWQEDAPACTNSGACPARRRHDSVLDGGKVCFWIGIRCLAHLLSRMRSHTASLTRVHTRAVELRSVHDHSRGSTLKVAPGGMRSAQGAASYTHSYSCGAE